jgi:dimethylsulfone monooxygenase
MRRLDEYPDQPAPRDIGDQLIELRGLHGVSLSFVNFRDELAYFLETVMPLLDSAGLRQAFRMSVCWPGN